MLIQFIVVQLVIFTIVIIVLKKLLLNDTMNAISRLRKIEKENKRREEELGIKMLEAEEMYKVKVAQAQEEALRVKEDSKKEMDSLKKEMLEKARLESDRIINAAKNITQELCQKLEEESEMKTIDCGLTLIKTVFTGRLRSAINEELAKELISQLGQLDKANIKQDLSQITIISAEAISGNLKEEIKKIISGKVAKELACEEKIDQSLIAGILIKLDGLIIDGSLSNYLREASGELKKEIEK